MPEPQIVIAAIGVLIAVVLVIKSSRSTKPSSRPHTADLMTMPLDRDIVGEIVRLTGERKKIQAIKALRVRTQLGLAEAKQLVEAIEAGHRPPVAGAPNSATKESPGAEESGNGENPADLADRARKLRDAGQETAAIRLVCDETGMGLVDAQKFVRSLT